MAIYETLDEFLSTANDDPEMICESLDIDVEYTSELPEEYLGLSDPLQQVIFINKKINQPFSRFILAHELTHTVLGDLPAAYLKSTYVTYLKVENEADQGALTLLLRSYTKTFDIELEDFNILAFLRYYQIPETYYFMVENIIEHY